MTSALTQFTVLQDLPIFTGNPREGEPYFRNEIHIKDFMRAIENYIAHNDIRDDSKKLSILYSLVDKRRGDAQRLVASFAGKVTSFEDVKQVFLDMYPSPEITNFSNAAKALLDLKITERFVFCAMTSVEAKAQAVTEAYINNTDLSEGQFSMNSVIVNNTNPAAADSTAGPSSPPVPPRSQGLPLVKLLHNFAMHLIISAQLDPKIYKKLQNVGPRKNSTALMAATVKATETYKKSKPLPNASRNKSQHEDTIWIHAEEPQQQQSQATARQQRGTPPQQPKQLQAQRPGIRCYNCNKPGHSRKECRTCSFCKIYGHTAKDCRKRIDANKGKYCHYCGISESHEEKDCRKKRADQAKSSPSHVRIVHPDGSEKGPNTGAETSYSYDSNTYDENLENPGGEPPQY